MALTGEGLNVAHIMLPSQTSSWTGLVRRRDPFHPLLPPAGLKDAVDFLHHLLGKRKQSRLLLYQTQPFQVFRKEFWRKWLFPPFFRCLICLSHFSCIFISSGSMPTGQCLSQSHKSLISQGLHWLGPLFDCTFGIFLRRRLYGSPDRHGVSSGLLGVDGGLTRDGDAMPPSLPVLRSSNSLKLRRSEFCLKKPGLEESCHWEIIIQSQLLRSP